MESRANGERPLLRAGHNCWRVERASRLAFLIDGEAYFSAVRSAITRAQRSIIIVGWDVDSRMHLVPSGAGDGYPEPLGEFLNAIVAERSSLRAYVLGWDYAMLYAFEREWHPVYQAGPRTHRRLSFHLDDQHPVAACHHQKLIIIDDSVAFIGGFDLTQRRWDRSHHAQDDPGRMDLGGSPYGPHHDVGAVVEGDCARALGEIAKERWLRATGRNAKIAAGTSTTTPWPARVEPDLCNVDVAISRTEPSFGQRAETTEVRQLHIDAIASARRWIFAENQYFTSIAIGEAFTKRLVEDDAPEIAIVMPLGQSGWLESSTMGVLRARLHRSLRLSDRNKRYRLYCPRLHWLGMDAGCLNVHSKLMIVDDALLTLGSANLSDRSMHLDTECNIAIEAGEDDDVGAAIATLRNRLMAEHLGVDAADVAAAVAHEKSLHLAIERLSGEPGRTLEATEPLLDPAVDAVTPDHGILDPEKPLDPDLLVADLLPKVERRDGLRKRLFAVLGFFIFLVVLSLAWRYTPLGQWIDFDSVAARAQTISHSPLAPIAVAVAYVAAGLLAIPLILLIAMTAVGFGPVMGGIYAVFGALLSGAVTYSIGRRLGRDTVRRLAGRHLNELSTRLGRRGLIAMVIVRLLPIAPFSVINVVAGSTQIGWRDFLLGTLIGIMPGIVMTMLFVNRAVEAIRHPSALSFSVLAVVAALVLATGWGIHRRLSHLSRSSGKGGAAIAGSGHGEP